MKYSAFIPFTFLLLLLLPLNANAYLGPGLGAGTIGAIIGVVGSIFLGIFAVIYYPIKRMLKKRGLIQKKNKSKITAGDTALDQNDDDGE